MKSLEQVIQEVLQPKSKEEQNFKDKHVVMKTDDVAGNDDSVYKGNTKKKKRIADNDQESSEAMYEKILEFIDSDDELFDENYIESLSYQELEIFEEQIDELAAQTAALLGKGIAKGASALVKAGKRKFTAQGRLDATKEKIAKEKAKKEREEEQKKADRELEALKRERKQEREKKKREREAARRRNESVDEREMTDAEMKKKDEIVKSMEKDKESFKDRYGSRWKGVLHATATKMAMKENTDLNEYTVYPMPMMNQENDIAVELDRDVLLAMLRSASFKLDYVHSMSEDDDVELPVSLKYIIQNIKSSVDELYNEAKYLENMQNESLAESIEEYDRFIAEKLDPLGKEDADIDNDGDIDDTDAYLKNRRKVITKAIKKQQNEDEDIIESVDGFEIKKTNEKRMTTAHPNGKFIHDVLYHGKKVGEIVPYSGYKDKKKPGSRIVDSRKDVTVYQIEFDTDGPNSIWLIKNARNIPLTGNSNTKEALERFARIYKMWLDSTEMNEDEDKIDSALDKMKPADRKKMKELAKTEKGIKHLLDFIKKNELD